MSALPGYINGMSQDSFLIKFGSI